MTDFAIRNAGDDYSDEWYTPAHVLRSVGLTFDLDPASPKGGLPWVPATRHYSIEDDGLRRDWTGRVWLNPPYSEVATWTRKLAYHGHGVALVFARTDTEWFQWAMLRADAVCFISGRLAFVKRNGEPGPMSAGAPSCLIAYGDDCAAAIATCGLGVTFALHGGYEDVQGQLWEIAA